MSIRGVFRGTIDADRVELLGGCQVYGALNVLSFFMDENVLLRAELNIRGAESKPVAALPAPEAETDPAPKSSSIPIVDPPSSSGRSMGGISPGRAPAEG